MHCEDVKIIEKPDEVSLEDITNLLHDAHMVNQEKGFELITANQNVEDTKDRLGNGKFIIALVKDELAACGAMIPKPDFRSWFYCGPCMEFHMWAVKRKFQGMGLAALIDKKREEIAFEQFDVIVSSTGRKNALVLNMWKKNGYIPVDYASFGENAYTSIAVAKWKDGCPHPIWYTIVYYYKKIRYILVRRDNGDIRSGLHWLQKLYKKYGISQWRK